MEQKSQYFINFCLLIFLLDPVALSTWRNNREKGMEDQDKRNVNETNQLEEELATYNDILYLDVYDIYRNIPEKLLQFYKW